MSKGNEYLETSQSDNNPELLEARRLHENRKAIERRQTSLLHRWGGTLALGAIIATTYFARPLIQSSIQPPGYEIRETYEKIMEHAAQEDGNPELSQDELLGAFNRMGINTQEGNLYGRVSNFTTNGVSINYHISGITPVSKAKLDEVLLSYQTSNSQE